MPGRRQTVNSPHKRAEGSRDDNVPQTQNRKRVSLCRVREARKEELHWRLNLSGYGHLGRDTKQQRGEGEGSAAAGR